MQNRKKRRVFSQEFKKQVVALHKSGKTRKEIIEDYDLTPSAFDKWVSQFEQSDLVQEDDNLTPEQKELEELRRENTKLKLENDILRQAALIFGSMAK
ncbi:transposase [Alkalibacterium sp. f15]|uniref:transposase n=1 Tax=Alkalibacterium sp. f15 TaxID=3414029 RepID=UPI003BF920B6